MLHSRMLVYITMYNSGILFALLHFYILNFIYPEFLMW